MLQLLVEKLNQLLSTRGMITDVVLRSDRSLLEDEEMREVMITFASSFEEEQPTATIHLFLLEDEQSCEVEVEIQYPGKLQEKQVQDLWEQARGRVAECSVTEKRRYTEPGKLVEASVQVDYHFVVQTPERAEQEAALNETLERFAADLGELVKLG
ncbi:hypothetical protein [Brevibacillus parabrevis]|uniref:Uncharacterized protein n=1 Tax=Brevibacillus parabrevis TaxID=54914 RepID=A0A4Y3PR11_BREPA|nr:hypothetical protein [Brevibacillus parabrevis]MBU8715584.1 hypothetical protein [Brevibacillus parabrevis]MED2254520.1 hypothetical protein [Brevibacillus parabrevis]RNB94682.1 hypothetical protein EDM60_15560 [Brevibacillus parabrevis]WDV93711.1 hypothetical protein PSE45_18900 [Brevibacillus parabrevis]GEB34396.1 hypothetical protein BPA01_39760 [Brevibacillus parabrevis]